MPDDLMIVLGKRAPMVRDPERPAICIKPCTTMHGIDAYTLSADPDLLAVLERIEAQNAEHNAAMIDLVTQIRDNTFAIREVEEATSDDNPDEPGKKDKRSKGIKVGAAINIF